MMNKKTKAVTVLQYPVKYPYSTVATSTVQRTTPSRHRVAALLGAIKEQRKEMQELRTKTSGSFGQFNEAGNGRTGEQFNG